MQGGSLSPGGTAEPLTGPPFSLRWTSASPGTRPFEAGFAGKVPKSRVRWLGLSLGIDFGEGRRIQQPPCSLPIRPFRCDLVCGLATGAGVPTDAARGRLLDPRRSKRRWPRRRTESGVRTQRGWHRAHAEGVVGGCRAALRRRLRRRSAPSSGGLSGQARQATLGRPDRRVRTAVALQAKETGTSCSAGRVAVMPRASTAATRRVLAVLSAAGSRASAPRRRGRWRTRREW